MRLVLSGARAALIALLAVALWPSVGQAQRENRQRPEPHMPGPRGGCTLTYSNWIELFPEAKALGAFGISALVDYGNGTGQHLLTSSQAFTITYPKPGWYTLTCQAVLSQGVTFHTAKFCPSSSTIQCTLTASNWKELFPDVSPLFINDPDALIDFGDGNGSQTLSPSTPISVTYAEPGLHTITCQPLSTVPTIWHRTYYCPDAVRVIVSEEEYCPPCDTMCVPRALPCDSTAEGYTFEGDESEDVTCESPLPDSCYVVCPDCVRAGARMTVANGCENNTDHLRKPLLFVEGVDFSLDNRNGQSGDFGYLNFFGGVTPDLDPIQRLPKLIQRLQADGYDVIFFDFADGATYVQANALALATAIRQINQEKVGDHELVVVAASMGGLVGRYALRYLERSCRPDSCAVCHNTRLYLTMDSPHLGANIPMGDQYLLSFFANQMDIADAKENVKKLSRPAPLQMLVNHVSAGGKPTLAHTRLFSDPNMAFPERPRLAAIANGSVTGVGQGFDPGDKMVDLYGGVPVIYDVVAYSRALPNGANVVVVAHGRARYISLFTAHATYRKVTSARPYDSCPGGFRNTNALIDKESWCNNPAPNPNHCFIPTISALGIKQAVTTDLYYSVNTLFQQQGLVDRAYFTDHSVSAFNTIYGQTANQQHLEITDQNVDWVMDEVSPASLYMQNWHAHVPTVREARTEIVAGRDVDPIVTRTLQGDYVVEGYCAKVVFRAGERVVLKDGFAVRGGGTFHAYALPMCPPPPP